MSTLNYMQRVRAEKGHLFLNVYLKTKNNICQTIYIDHHVENVLPFPREFATFRTGFSYSPPSYGITFLQIWI